MHALTAHSGVSPADRLGVTTFFAILAHLIVILGVTFVHEERPARSVTTLDVVLVPASAAAVPERADYLAQANRDDSGEGMRPEAPPPAPAAAGEPSAARVRATAAPTPHPDPPGTESRPADPAPAFMAAIIAEHGPADSATPVRDTGVPAPASRSAAIAVLAAELERKLRKYPELPRRKWISARTREHAFAAYMDTWRRKVERVGSLNYPTEALQDGLSGSLLLEVALNPDGTVNDIVLRRSSGVDVLDDAAVRTVKLAAPFARFPETIAGEVDVLHIERTWFFHSGNGFSSP